ncbi:hypothetical protein F443_02132 [Phytophthora nicotianae P1569]|uniref:Uncharacterized protein n=2 Tax=Phytophthora nicotianae TaxID=4792 RepID=V9FVT0_PHYNI|nr:hypothetical protein F443_02132 [Phytophthora nicotianae P1569]
MARTHKTAQIKAQMAEKARIEEEEARRREEVRIADLDSARTRSEKAGALVRACERQNSPTPKDPLVKNQKMMPKKKKNQK